jgi:solute carrier family 36 (proton-coupled amino acid transporter)
MKDSFDANVDYRWFGKQILMLNCLGLLCFVIYAPLCLVRKIEKFSITHIFADALILITTIVILVYASIRLGKQGWGEGVLAINTATWLDMIGSAVYSYEGIGVVLPLLEVTQKPELYPKILLYVLLTVMFLYVGFGEYCLFIYGEDLKLPLITANLPKGAIV